VLSCRSLSGVSHALIWALRSHEWHAGPEGYLEGIVGLARTTTPLWVFSLNHDLIVEESRAGHGRSLEIVLRLTL
jgi:hypothetical protein